MGSKNKIIGNIWEAVQDIEFESVLDAFSGSGVVSYFFKTQGKKVISNDFLAFSSYFTKSIVENSHVRLGEQDVSFLLNNKGESSSFIQDKFRGLYFTDDENKFLDRLRVNIDLLEDDHKKALALSAIARACMKRRARGIFTYVGYRYDDGRKDMQLDLREHFIENMASFNDAVFDNGHKHRSFNQNIFDLDVKPDLVYFDPPYITPNSDNDYTRRYHFIEGYIKNWEGLEIQEHTKTKKFKRYKSLFDTRSTAYLAFEQLFEKFKDCVLVVSYSSNCFPTKTELTAMLKRYKDDVHVMEVNHTYSFGNQTKRVGNHANKVKEYIFIAQ